MSTYLRHPLVLGLVSLHTLSGCGGFTPADAVRPDAMSAADALGGEGAAECRQVPSRATPLVVDWKSAERVDLEAAMSDGVVIVKYDCKSLTVLPGCKRKGSYAFAPVQRKEETLQLSSADELQANVPLGMANLGGEVGRSSSLDVALVLVGKRSVPLMQVLRSELEGDCEGATHAVRSANVGAFAVATGQQGTVRAVAEMFGASAGGSSDSSRKSLNRDGELEACRKSTLDAKLPPDQCGSPVRLELVAIEEKARASAPGQEAPIADTAECPQGMSMQDGKCTRAADRGFVCREGDYEECRAQCEAGNAVSCYRAGVEPFEVDMALLTGKPDEKAREELRTYEHYRRMIGALTKSCDGGYMPGCHRLGQFVVDRGLDDKRKVYTKDAKDPQRAVALWTRGCELGEPQSCETLASLHGRGQYVQASPEKALELATRACDLGSWLGCGYASELSFKKATRESEQRGIALLEKACLAGQDANCVTLAMKLLEGELLARDEAKALDHLTRSCRRSSVACSFLGGMYGTGELGLKKDATKARSWYARGCESDVANRGAGCERAAEAYEDAKLGPVDLRKAMSFRRQACESDANFCAGYASRLADGRGADKDPKAAIAVAERGCKEHASYCMVYENLLVEHAPARAKIVLRERCDKTSGHACELLNKLR